MKKLFAILLVVAMLLALAGCAGGETSSDNPSNNSNASVSSSDADPIRIGIWTSLTGASAIEGELIENGARLAAAQWNAKGGINGRQIDFVVYDDQSTTEGAVTATTRLIENDKVDAIIGSNLSIRGDTHGQGAFRPAFFNTTVLEQEVFSPCGGVHSALQF